MTLLKRHPLYFPFRFVKRLLPKGLFARTLLIIVLPTLIALSVATFVFFDRHWSTTTQRLSYALAGDIGVVIDLMEREPDEEEEYIIRDLAKNRMDLRFTVDEVDEGFVLHRRRSIHPLHVILGRALYQHLPYVHRIQIDGEDKAVGVEILVQNRLYSFQAPSRRIYTPTTEVFIIWMIGSSILLSVIALLFMRNQIRPVRRLAAASEAIGKGQDVPWFKEEGALEVRQAGAALMVMRDRIRRTVMQRTAMLAGVSHDLRTPLTRMKLQLAMMPENAATRGFRSDIEDMEVMLEGYLAFARGEDAEPDESVQLGRFLSDVVDGMNRQKNVISIAVENDIVVSLRPGSMKRCIENLLSNALRYAKTARVVLSVKDQLIEILIDDDGPGIPQGRREDVFKPFLRLDESRNMGTGGVGLGLSIARDIARSHGGDVVLEDSPMGGLRVRVWLPV